MSLYSVRRHARGGHHAHASRSEIRKVYRLGQRAAQWRGGRLQGARRSSPTSLLSSSPSSLEHSVLCLLQPRDLTAQVCSLRLQPRALRHCRGSGGSMGGGAPAARCQSQRPSLPLERNRTRAYLGGSTASFGAMRVPCGRFTAILAPAGAVCALTRSLTAVSSPSARWCGISSHEGICCAASGGAAPAPTVTPSPPTSLPRRAAPCAVAARQVGPGRAAAATLSFSPPSSCRASTTSSTHAVPSNLPYFADSARRRNTMDRPCQSEMAHSQIIATRRATTLQHALPTRCHGLETRPPSEASLRPWRAPCAVPRVQA